MLRAYRFQLRLKPAQERALRRWSGALRWVWNAAIAEQQRRRARGEKFASYAQMCTWLTTWRNAPETAWLAEGPCAAQQQTLKRLEDAYKRFFTAVKAGQAGGRGRTGAPRFKARGFEPGLRFPDKNSLELDQATARIKLPKLGWVRLRLSQPVAGELRNASLSCERGRWCLPPRARAGAGHQVFSSAGFFRGCGGHDLAGPSNVPGVAAN